MDNSINSALSGLNAFSTRQDVTANNVANMLTAKFKPADTVMQSQEGGGVAASVELSGADSVDISKETVDLIINQTGFEANTKTMETSDKMQKSLIDIKV